MQLKLDESHLMLQQLCRDFVKTEVRPQAKHADERAEFPQAIIQQCAQMGLMGIFVPSPYGGANMDRLSAALVVEELSQGCASTALIVSVHNFLVCGTLLQYGSEAQRQKWLPDLAQGKKLGCFCLTESEAGSDIAALKTEARSEGDEWVITGTKTLVTNALEADLAIVFARSTESSGRQTQGISVFGVPLQTPGVVRSQADDKLGVRAASTASLTFKQVRIPKNHLIAKPGMGFYIAFAVLTGGRVGIAAQALGIAQAAYGEALSYAKQREQFGHSIATYQGIQWMLADMVTEITAARLLTYRAAAASGGSPVLEASIAKLFASEMAMRVTDRAIQIHGGYGYIKEFPVERYYRDAKVTEIYSGTSEIQRYIIASQLLSGEIREF